MSIDIFSNDRSRRARWSSYFYYIANNIVNILPPPLKYPIFRLSLGNIGDNTVIEPGVYFSGFEQIYLGRDVFVGRNTSFYAYIKKGEEASISIGDHVLIAPHVIITTLGHDYLVPEMPNRCRSVKIESSVWIGAGAVILPGVTLNEGVIVGAGAVVTQSVPPWKIVAGTPARVIKDRPPYE